MKNLSILAALLISAPAMAQDPILQTNYTADPAPLVHNDTIFLYTSHDDDAATGFLMKNWLLYTSTDMVNWTDHGPVASLKNFNWFPRDNGAWAIQVVERNGKFYMYCPLHGNGIGVLVADSPYGPFLDPIGKPLVWQREHWNDIDPTVFIDEDGQAYMYWGNPDLYMVKLNEDMISYSGEIVKFPKIPDYQEGPWFWRRGENYYLAFASTCCPEGIGYAMSKSPTGPWEYKGHIMDHTERTRGNHPGIIDYKGKTYVFGQNSDLLFFEQDLAGEPRKYMERRSISAAEMHYKSDGSIEEVPYWKDNVLKCIQPFNPYQLVPAPTMAWGVRLRTDRDGQGFMYLKDIDDGETLMLRDVDFGEKGAKRFIATTRTATVSGNSIAGQPKIEIRLDSKDGKLIGTLTLTPSKTWITEITDVKGAKGVHDLYFCFKGDGKNLFEFANWSFQK